MKPLITSALLLLALTVAACAPLPGAIAPVPQGLIYAALTCEQATANLASIQADLKHMNRIQTVTAVADAVFLAGAGIAVSKVVGGDKSGDIAGMKGEVISLNARLMGCN